MAKTFLRVGANWTLMAHADVSPLFFLNISGTSVQVQLTTEAVTGYSTFKHPFTVGGNICQLKAPLGTYHNARARADDPLKEGVLVMDSDRISLLEVENYRADIDRLNVELLKLTQRVTHTELADVNHHAEYILAMRELYDVNNRLSIFGMTLQNQILRLHKRLFAAERLVQKFRNDFGTLDAKVSAINNDSVSGVTAALRVSIANILTTVENLVTRMNIISPKVEALYASTTGGIKEALEPIQASIAEIHTDFTDLNNALVKMSSEKTASEIIENFNEVIGTVSDEMVGPIEALRDILVDLAIINEKNEAQDVDLENALSIDDPVIFEPTTDLLREV